MSRSISASRGLPTSMLTRSASIHQTGDPGAGERVRRPREPPSEVWVGQLPLVIFWTEVLALPANLSGSGAEPAAEAAACWPSELTM